MKSRVGLGVLLLAAAIDDGRLIACGDKYLSVGFGTHFERTPAERKQATVLVYAEPGSDLDGTFTAPVKATISKEGYQFFFVSSQAELDKAVRGRPPQVIIAEGRHSRDLCQRTNGQSHIVPVLYSPTQGELKQMRRTHEPVIKTPKKGSTFVDATDDAFVILEIEAEAAAKAAAKAAKNPANAAKTAAKKGC